MRWSYTLALVTLLYLRPSSASLEPLVDVDLNRDVDLAFEFAQNNGTASRLEKRWLLQEVGPTWTTPTSTNPSNSWLIVYCFSSTVSSADRATLKDLIDRAWQTWVLADTTQPYHIDHLSLIQGSATVCGDSRATNVLGIVTNGDRTAYTNVYNKPPFISVDLIYANNHARGPLTVVAHEIGHAWGLLHEHQRADSQVGNGGHIKFDCTALADWEKLNSPAATDPLCTSVYTASDNKFSASQFIPYVQPASSPRYGSAPDYNSIMMYAGQAGAKPDANGPNGLAVTLMDTSQNPNVPFVAQNRPSAGDVAGLAALYPKTGSITWGRTPVNVDQLEAVNCLVGSISTMTIVQ